MHHVYVNMARCSNFELEIGCSIEKTFRLLSHLRNYVPRRWKISGRRIRCNVKLERRGDVIKSNKDELLGDKLHILSHYFGIV